MMFSTYSVFSLVGLVSSKRKLQTPPNFSATPKSMQMALACPICIYPFGSGGKRVCILPPFLPSARSVSTICSTKLRLFFSSFSVRFFSISMIYKFLILIAKLHRILQFQLFQSFFLSREVKMCYLTYKIICLKVKKTVPLPTLS